MSLVLERKRRTREITGPTPNAVAIRARPTLKKPPEFLILENRKKDELRNQVLAEAELVKQLEFKTEWERSTHKRIQQAVINRRVEGILQHEKFHLERRRDKLRELLAKEEEEQLAEIEARQQTTLERQAKMRERARSLREKREAERDTLAKEKLDQRWRDECEELRAVMSKRNTDQVCMERSAQLKLKSEMEKQQRQEEQMFTALWERDRQLKAQREEAETVGKLERNREMLKTLNLQLAALEEQKQREKQLKKEEAQFVEEQIALRKMEEERRQQYKLQAQRDRRRELKWCTKKRDLVRAQEEKEAIALDIKLLQQLLLDTKNEAEEQVQRKQQLHEEMQRYMAYLKEEAENEKQREVNLERALQQELDKADARTLEKWQQERDARERLMQDVLRSREQQIQEKLQRNRAEQEEVKKEREHLQRIFEEHQRLEEEEKQRRWLTAKQHQMDLRDQLSYQKLRTAMDKEDEHMQYMELQHQEQLYKERLATELAKEPHAYRTHPVRHAMSAASSNNL